VKVRVVYEVAARKPLYNPHARRVCVIAYSLVLSSFSSRVGRDRLTPSLWDRAAPAIRPPRPPGAAHTIGGLHACALIGCVTVDVDSYGQQAAEKISWDFRK